MEWLFNMEGLGFGMLVALIVCFVGPLFTSGGKQDGRKSHDEQMEEAGFRQKFINGKWYWVPKDEC